MSHVNNLLLFVVVLDLPVVRVISVVFVVDQDVVVLTEAAKVAGEFFSCLFCLQPNLFTPLSTWSISNWNEIIVQ